MALEPDVGEESARLAVGDAAVTDRLEIVRRKHGAPAIAAAIVTSEGLVAVGAVGVRKAGESTPVALDDKWHLGSDTKAMTSALVGLLVEQGTLKWDLTLAEAFPDLSPDFHADMRGVTLRQLLSHRAGLAANLDFGAVSRTESVREQRLTALKGAAATAPEHKPGGKFLYSNLGYIIAGAVIERATGKSWEASIQELLFDPLGMTSVGFGGVGTPGKLDQPWGHRDNGAPVVGNGPAVDNPPIMGPAGRVHCSIQDWARFIADQLRGARGEPGILKRDTYRMLHTPPDGSDYALGWIVTKRDWAGGTALSHGGSNTMNYANVWLAPARDFAILVCVNQGGDVGFKASDAAVGALIALHNESREGAPQ